MPSAHRVAAVVVVLVVAVSGCTHSKNGAAPGTSGPPSVLSSSDSSLPATAAPTDSSTTSATASESSSDSSSAEASSSPPASGSSPASTDAAPSPEDATDAPSDAPTKADPVQLATAQKLLVAGVDLGPKWESTEIPPEENTHEQGDLCGTVTAGQKNRVFDVATDLSNDDSVATGRHEIARYQPGAAAAAAHAILDRLAHCSHVNEEFDGSPAEVTVTPVSASVATFSLTFGPGSVQYGAVAISNTRDYLSTSASFAPNVAAAAQLARDIDAAAKRKLAAAGVT